MEENNDKITADSTSAGSDAPSVVFNLPDSPEKPAGKPGNKTQPFTPPEGIQDTATQKVSIAGLMNNADDRKALKISCHRCLQKLDVTSLEPFAHFDCPACNADLIVPKWFDSYLLEEPGGIGGMATVYRALDIALDREVAIKVLNPEVANVQDRVDLFLHEARTAATINHYAVVPIYTCGVFEGQPYIIMQFMSGGSLESKLKIARGVLPVNDVVKWIRDVAEGLGCAMNHGIVHHDIKPGNIMLDADGNAKVGDFGIAHIIKDKANAHIIEMTKGWISPHYVSPEKVASGDEDSRGDMYSLGATFYHLLTGFTPFSHTNVDELIWMRTKSDPVPPHQHRPEIGANLSRLVLAMMDRDPSRRPTYREVVKALSSHLKGPSAPQGQAVAATQLKVPKIMVQKSTVEPGSTAKRPVQQKASYTGLIYTLVMLAVLIGLLYFAWTKGVLSRYLAFIPAPTAEASVSKDYLPDVTITFGSGSPKYALELAMPLFEQTDAPAPARAQAAIQVAIAHYLLKDPKAAEACEKLLSKLEVIEVDPNVSVEEITGGGEKKATPAQIIVKYLSKDKADPELFRLELMEASPEHRSAGELAVFLASVYRGAQSAEMSLNLTKYTESLTEVSPDSWASGWSGRIPFWKQCITKNSGMIAEVEPLFVPLIKKKESWAFIRRDASDVFGSLPLEPRVLSSSAQEEGAVSSSTPKTSEDTSSGGTAARTGSRSSGMESAAKTSVSKAIPKTDGKEAEDISDKDTKTASISAETVRESSGAMPKRPCPPSPVFSQSAMDKYLSSLPADKKDVESERAAIVMSVKEYAGRLMIRIPYETDNFTTLSGSQGKGVVMGNSSYLSFKNSRNKRTKYEWNQLPVKEYVDILEFYAKIREQTLKSSSSVNDADRKVLSDDYTRIAVLLMWYGKHEEAAKYAEKALKSDPKQVKVIERLLLK